VRRVRQGDLAPNVKRWREFRKGVRGSVALVEPPANKLEVNAAPKFGGRRDPVWIFDVGGRKARARSRALASSSARRKWE